MSYDGPELSACEFWITLNMSKPIKLDIDWCVTSSFLLWGYSPLAFGLPLTLLVSLTSYRPFSAESFPDVTAKPHLHISLPTRIIFNLEINWDIAPIRLYCYRIFHWMQTFYMIKTLLHTIEKGLKIKSCEVGQNSKTYTQTPSFRLNAENQHNTQRKWNKFQPNWRTSCLHYCCSYRACLSNWKTRGGGTLSMQA
jgi:hypothetical protein